MDIPYKWSPAPHQRAFIANGARFKVGVWHRKCWKTSMAVNELLRWANTVKGTYWYVAPFLSQAKKIVWEDPEMFPKYCPPEIWDKRNNSDLTIKFPNGSIIYVLGADNPDSLRGPNPRGVVLDEYGDMKPEVWSAIVQPIMTANPDAWTWFMGTPKGRNDFFTKYNYASQEGNPNWFASLMKASTSGIIRAEDLEEARKTTTAAFFGQEYECEFIESATSFFRRIKECLYDVMGVDKFGNPLELKPRKGWSYQLGVDLAKYQDWTVITPFCLNTFKVGEMDRFNQVDWPLQKAKIEAKYYQWQKPIVRIDSTGVGDPIVDDLIAMGVDINRDAPKEQEEAVKFTETRRRQLLDNLAINIEQRRIQLPNDEGLVAELESMQYTLTKAGKVRVAVPEGLHDDRIMSLALAVWGAGDKPIGIPKEEEEEQESLNDRLDRYAVI
jgi:phage FluMu gp28-like protein